MSNFPELINIDYQLENLNLLAPFFLTYTMFGSLLSIILYCIVIIPTMSVLVVT